jgi:predicted nuclease of predicted toxin-antitoxin system
VTVVQLLLDEDFNNDILRGLLRRNPDIDVVRVQDVPAIAGAADPVILAWAAQAGRVLFTHDVNTMTAYATERIENGQPMSGISW